MTLDTKLENYKIIIKNSKKRKTLALSVRKPFVVNIYAPFFVDKKAIVSFINKSFNWIEKHNYLLLKKSIKTESFLKKEKLIFDFNSTELLIKDLNKKKWLEIKEDFYDFLFTKISALEKDFYLDDNYQIKLVTGLGKWGSCKTEILKSFFYTKRKVILSFNLAMVILPTKVIDYIVFHEMCHILVPNHSLKFWNLVKKYDPDFYKNKKTLKKYSFYLSFFKEYNSKFKEK